MEFGELYNKAREEASRGSDDGEDIPADSPDMLKAVNKLRLDRNAILRGHKTRGDLLEMARMVIANVGIHKDGWPGQHEEWIKAAEKWRDDYHKAMPGAA